MELDSAVRVQALLTGRGVKNRWQRVLLDVAEASVVGLQAVVRGKESRNLLQGERNVSSHAAAEKIQAALHGCEVRRVYRTWLRSLPPAHPAHPLVDLPIAHYQYEDVIAVLETEKEVIRKSVFSRKARPEIGETRSPDAGSPLRRRPSNRSPGVAATGNPSQVLDQVERVLATRRARRRQEEAGGTSLPDLRLDAGADPLVMGAEPLVLEEPLIVLSLPGGGKHPGPRTPLQAAGSPPSPLYTASTSHPAFHGTAEREGRLIKEEFLLGAGSSGRPAPLPVVQAEVGAGEGLLPAVVAAATTTGSPSPRASYVALMKDRHRI